MLTAALVTGIDLTAWVTNQCGDPPDQRVDRVDTLADALHDARRLLADPTPVVPI
ncbi:MULTISPECIES: hypothetical protein [Rhodococcus]|uniref:Uncharacterized protein n=1 Tax=Rhodococcus oxybenzonivorans TaxID=1990687 RepID=A0AAE4UWD5_9NOCA|nr:MULTISPECIES: hypothetical protein [Rhodococcus]MDV7243887.1 hypothetical protein [Rhodococcus oxybenzonivorans]MDV7263854.1 hypothetical protein [Rhodococcus oxybenzonivorans]MDV7274871.1 hypothetical protein [Rhodococcus oxybenzonivorans]MDV7335110.1 hypothetical protein [Rhodococcus oxybenzonivorans]MDV7345821.1 hypothetical protein [Rhodococcus oxybenzonivorans]